MRIHPQDVQTLQHFPPQVQLVITTGRDLHSVKSILGENGLYINHTLSLPGVFMNGGVIYRPGEKIFEVHAFLPETRREVVELVNQFPKTAFVFFAVDVVYLVNPNNFGRLVTKAHHLTLLETDSAHLPETIIKVSVLEPKPKMLEAIKDKAQGLFAEMANSLIYAYEINPPGINKSASLLALLKSLNLEGLPIYAVGDAENDLSLLKLAQTSFAPTTAQPQVIDHADYFIERERNGLLSPILTHIQSSEC